MKKYRWNAIIERIDKNKITHIAEIGVWKGGVSKKLLEALPNMNLIQVDRWEAYSRKEIELENARMAHYPQEIFEEVRIENLKNIKPYRDRVEIFRMSSISVTNIIVNKSLDLVFLDAFHHYEGIKADIFAWLPKVKPDGWIGGHDYKRSGVKKAVDEIFGNKVEIDVDKTWWVKV